MGTQLQETGSGGQVVRAASKEVGREVAMWVARTWALPLLAPLAVAVLGMLERQPMMYILIGALAAFAFVMHGMNQLATWQYQRTAEHKLHLSQPHIATVRNDKGTPIALALGFVLKNEALFPIRVILDDMRTDFAGRVSKVPRPKYPKELGWVSAGSKLFYHDTGIELQGLDTKGTMLVGSVEYKIRYGTKKPTYDMHNSYKMIVRFDDNGEVSTANMTGGQS